MSETSAPTEEWSVHEVARRTGTTTRTLRHYDAIGLLEPSRTGPGGYRFYDMEALVRLQRILLLRELGLGLPAIAQILHHQRDPVAALRTHVALLQQEQDRLARQIDAVRATMTRWEGGDKTMTEDMFDGFDHTRYREEVEQRWGAEAYARSDQWWRGLTEAERSGWQGRVAQLNADWADAAARGVSATSPEAQALAERHVAWLRSVPGTPGDAGAAELRAYVLGLAEMYVADPRFAANYATPAGDTSGAEFVRDALAAYVETALT